MVLSLNTILSLPSTSFGLQFLPKRAFRSHGVNTPDNDIDCRLSGVVQYLINICYLFLRGLGWAGVGVGALFLMLLLFLFTCIIEWE